MKSQARLFYSKLTSWAKRGRESPEAHSSTPRDYWCFISYRHLDNRDEGRKWATWLHRQLETYEIPPDLVGKRNERNELIPKRIYPVFRDENELKAGELKQKIYAALDKSKTLVVLCSPRVTDPDSLYVKQEIRHFKKKAGNSQHVYAALLEGTPNSAFPETLRYKVDAAGVIDKEKEENHFAPRFCLEDGTQGWTTAWHYSNELRKTKSLGEDEIERRVAEYTGKLSNAKFQIIASVLGVPLDALLKRDHAYQLELARSRNRKLLLWLTAVGVLAIIAGAATATAFQQKKTAENAKAVALQQQKAAEQNFETAKQAADSLVTDVARELRDVQGMTAAAVKKILSKAETTYDRILEKLPENRELLLGKAAMYREFVATYLQTGDTESAKKAATESCVVTDRVIALFPDDRSLKKIKAESLLKLGDAFIETTGSSDEAEKHYAASLSLFETLLGENPGSPELKRQVSAAHLRLAEVDETKGRYDQGETRVRKALAVRREMIAGSIRAKADYLVTLVRLLDFMILKKDLPGAQSTSQHIDEVTLELSHEDPTNARYDRYQAIASQRMGNVHMELEHFAEAEKFFLASRDKFKKLSEQDRENLELKQDLAIAIQKLAGSAKGMGKLDLAKELYRDSIGRREGLVAGNPDVHHWSTDLAETYFELGRLESGERRHEYFSAAKKILLALEKKGSLGNEQLGWLREIEAEAGEP